MKNNARKIADVLERLYNVRERGCFSWKPECMLHIIDILYKHIGRVTAIGFCDASLKMKPLGMEAILCGRQAEHDCLKAECLFSLC